MSSKTKSKMKQKTVQKSESSETSSEDDNTSSSESSPSSSSSSSSSSSAEEEVVQKRAKKQKRAAKYLKQAHTVDEEVQRYSKSYKHRKKGTEDYEAELNQAYAQRKRRRRREVYYEDVSDVIVKQEPVDELDSHRSVKRHKFPDSYASHRHRGMDGDGWSERHRMPEVDEYGRPDQGDHHRRYDHNHRRPDRDDYRRPDHDDYRRPDHDDYRRPEHDDHRRPDYEHRRPDHIEYRRQTRKKQGNERSQYRSGNRETGGRCEEDEAQQNGKLRRDRKEPTVKEEPAEAEFEWGKKAEKVDGAKKNVPATEKEKPNFGLSGKLAEETNTFKGVVLKYSEPPEARKPKKRWRLYPFKGEKSLQTLYVHRQSAYLIGRDRKIADLPVDHPSCSKQHAVFQYRLLPYTREDGTTGRRIRPYIIDLESANGTFLNNVKIEARKYVEVLERDVIKFGFSSREYVLLHEHSKDDDADEDVQDEQTTDQAGQNPGELPTTK